MDKSFATTSENETLTETWPRYKKSRVNTSLKLEPYFDRAILHSLSLSLSYKLFNAFSIVSELNWYNT